MKKFTKKSNLSKISLVVLTTVTLGVLAGCGDDTTSSGDDATSSGDSATEEVAQISGEITVLTNDANNDELFEEYEKRFIEKYPEVTAVNFEPVQDYDNNLKVRMSTDKYGDVLLNPNLSADKYADFFEPLGPTEELKQIYTFAERGSYDGQVYMIPMSGDVSGIMYNKKVFEEAGITEMPHSIDEFINDLQLIKDNTDAIPWYSNYNAGWPLSQLKGNEAVIAGDEGYRNQTLPHDPEPFAPGKPNYVLYKMLYDITAAGLIEDDPVTSDFDKSMQMIADGDVATMGIGSWAIQSARGNATNPEDVGFMAFPDESNKAMLNAGYGMAVNVNSKNKDTAKAFVDFFIRESGYALTQGNVPGVVGAELPETLSDLTANNVEFIIELPALQGEEGITENMVSESEVGLYDEKFGRRIIDTALGKSQEGFTSYDDICAKMNEDWAAAQKVVFEKYGITE